MYMMMGGIFLSLTFCVSAVAQITAFPFDESFDSVSVPSLPDGWTSSTNRLAAGDFFTTTTSPRSDPNAVQTTNARITQFLTSPRFDFTGKTPEALRFAIARSTSHTSPLIVEWSMDNGLTFKSLGDTLFHPGTSAYVTVTLSLPPALIGQSDVRFRWRLVAGSGGATGTLRLDDLVLTTTTMSDLGFDQISLHPPFPSRNSPLDIRVRIRNRGAIVSPPSEVVLLFQMAGRSDRFASHPVPPLAPDAVSELTIVDFPPSHGALTILAQVISSGDERPENDTLSIVADIGLPRGTIVVNEIMYAPVGDEPEWIELYNTDHEPQSLAGWKISDANTSAAVAFGLPGMMIAPSGYALIAKDRALMTLRPIPPVPISIVNFNALNNTTPDAVVLFDHRGAIQDSAYYRPEWSSSPGSLERVDASTSSVERETWGSSEDSTGATPGRLNSIARLEHDLGIVSARAEGSTIVVEVRNHGKSSAEKFSVEYYNHSAGHTTPFGKTVFEHVLPPDVTAILRYDWPEAPLGETVVLVKAVWPRDGRVRNNTRVLILLRSFPARELVINEFMFEPLSGQNEWVELFHRGTRPVDLFGWTVSDAPTSSGARTTLKVQDARRTINPGEFVVLAAESSLIDLFPTLILSENIIVFSRPGGFGFGNDGDDIVLRDLSGALIDSVHFSPSWHHPAVPDTRGRSLERIHPDMESNEPRHWSTSAVPTGGTPGKPNSIFTDRLASSANLSFSPNPFSPDGDGFEDFCLIRYQLPSSTSVIRLRIFDRSGRLITTIADSEPSGPEGERIWNGYDDTARRARIGPYIVLLEAIDPSGAVVMSARGVIVVATRL